MANIDTSDQIHRQSTTREQSAQQPDDCLHQNAYDEILFQLKANQLQPLLIEGARGCGKSYLIKMIHQHRHWSIFIDGQSSNILCLADLLLEVLLQCSRRHCAQASPLAETLKATLQTLQHELDDARIIEQVIDLLSQLNTSQQPLLLCIDNLPELLKDGGSEFIASLDEQLKSGQFSLLASARTPLAKLIPTTRKHLEQYQSIVLESLSSKQCEHLLRCHLPHIDHALIRPLQILTHHSPKALFAMAQSPMNTIEQPFKKMVDGFNDSYQLKLKAIAPKERKVYLALAELWQPSTTKQITDKARMDMRAASALLGRLVSKGLVVEQQGGQTGKGKIYSLADPLLSLWYLSSADKEKTPALMSLLQFMGIFYRHKDWAAQRQAILNEPDQACALAGQSLSNAWPQQTLCQALLEAIDTNKLAMAIGDKETYEQWLEDYVQPIEMARQSGNMAALLSSATKLFEQPVVNQFELLRCIAKAFIAIALETDDNPIKALNSYQELCEDFGQASDPLVQMMVAQSLVNMGLCFERLQQYEAASKCYSDAIAKATAGHHSHMQRIRANALYLKGQSYQVLEKPASAVNVLAKLSNEFAEHLDSKIQAVVARSYVKQGQIWLALEQHSHALKSLNKLIESMRQNTQPQVQLCVAKAHLMQSYLFEKQNKISQALAHLDNLLGLWQDKKAPSSRLRQYLAESWLQRAILLFKSGNAAEAMSSLRRVFANSAKHATPSFSALALVTYLAADKQKLPQLLELFEQNPALQQNSLPLWIALKQEMNEPVMAAKEVLAVAADIRQSIAQNRATLQAQ